VFKPTFKREYWVEAFCDEEPHMPGTRIWFVWQNGQEIQPAPSVIRAMTVDNIPVMTGWFGHFAQHKITKLVLTLIGCAFFLKAFFF
jgi:hypothetical protein